MFKTLCSCFVLKFNCTPLKESTRLRRILHFFNTNTALYWQYDNTSHFKKTASFFYLTNNNCKLFTMVRHVHNIKFHMHQLSFRIRWFLKPWLVFR